MVVDINVEFVLVTAFFVLPMIIVADDCSLLYGPFVENFGVDVKETPVLEGKVRHWVSSVGHSGLEVIFSIQIVEPNCKLGVPDSWVAIVVKLSHFDLIGQEMSYSMSGQCSSQAMPCHSK